MFAQNANVTVKDFASKDEARFEPSAQLALNFHIRSAAQFFQVPISGKFGASLLVGSSVLSRSYAEIINVVGMIVSLDDRIMAVSYETNSESRSRHHENPSNPPCFHID